MGRLAEEAFATTGLAPSHGYLLMQVSDKPGIPLGRVAEVLALDASTVTRIIERLETRGLIEKKIDGRSRSLFLTPAGRALIPSVRSAWADLQSRYNSLLGEDHARVITRLSFATSQMLSASIT